jgi:acetoin:2,6-dichlorophenolindophenol oxidoreductase subunit alpha
MNNKELNNSSLLLDLYTTMLRIRRFEEEGVKLYRNGDIRGYFHPYWGEEAIATGVCKAMEESDYITSTHRGHGHCIAWGADLKTMFAELLGRENGYCKGLGGSMHIADYTKNNLGANGIVGSGVPIAVGAALGAKIRNRNSVVATFISDGGSNIGSFLEGLNLASAFKLPVLFVIENNQYAVSTPIEQSTGEPELYKRGIGFGIEGLRINGNNVREVYETASDFINRCRKGEGPLILECLTFRKSGHHVNDPGLYLPEEKVKFYSDNDPLKVAKKLLLSEEGKTEEEINHVESEVSKEIAAAVKYALESEVMSVESFLKFAETY